MCAWRELRADQQRHNNRPDWTPPAAAHHTPLRGRPAQDYSTTSYATPAATYMLAIIIPFLGGEKAEVQKVLKTPSQLVG